MRKRERRTSEKGTPNRGYQENFAREGCLGSHGVYLRYSSDDEQEISESGKRPWIIKHGLKKKPYTFDDLIPYRINGKRRHTNKITTNRKIETLQAPQNIGR